MKSPKSHLCNLLCSQKKLYQIIICFVTLSNYGRFLVAHFSCPNFQIDVKIHPCNNTFLRSRINVMIYLKSILATYFWFDSEYNPSISIHHTLFYKTNKEKEIVILSDANDSECRTEFDIKDLKSRKAIEIKMKFQFLHH